MTEVYLGKPPEHIESWIKEHFKTSIWMPAVYTDNWVYSDSEDHHISLDNLSETGGGEGWSWVLDY